MTLRHCPHAPLRHLQEALAVTVDAMRAYFLPVRFYSRYYPYMGFRSAMVHIALERTREVGVVVSSPQKFSTILPRLPAAVLPVLPGTSRTHAPNPCSARPRPADAAHRRQHGAAGGRGSSPAQQPPQPSPGGAGTLVWFGER